MDTREYECFAGLSWGVQDDPCLNDRPDVLTLYSVRNNKLYREMAWLSNDPDKDRFLSGIKYLLDLRGVRLLGCNWATGRKDNERLRAMINKGYMRVLEFAFKKEVDQIEWDKDRSLSMVNPNRRHDFHKLSGMELDDDMFLSSFFAYEALQYYYNYQIKIKEAKAAA